MITRRLTVYADEVTELFGCYADRGLLHHVNGIGHLDAVAARIWEELGLTA